MLGSVCKACKCPRGAVLMVTGATSGIGRAYAQELAKRGLNVVLISRSLQKLKQVAAEIEEQHGRRTRVIEADFTQGSEIYESIQTTLQGLEIGILVNNVGMFYAMGPVNFLDVPNIEKVGLVQRFLPCWFPVLLMIWSPWEPGNEARSLLSGTDGFLMHSEHCSSREDVEVGCSQTC
uniref:Uncharacterized protein n=1 Tax=Terrapene triunguis TaxID=2587831 RepID=A0A674IPJ2_9SAUR